jgi:hypothetical protein
MQPRIASLILSFTLLLGTGTVEGQSSDADAWSANLQRPFSTVDASDGIDELEANYLVFWCFLKFRGVCGGPVQVTKGDVWWTTGTAVGFSGANGGDIRIHRKLGMITWTASGWIPAPWKALEPFIKEQMPLIFPEAGPKPSGSE